MTSIVRFDDPEVEVQDPLRPPPRRTGLAAQARQPASVGLTPIDPAQDLRSQQITPGRDPRLESARSDADTAQRNVASFSGYTPFQAVNPNNPYVGQANTFTSNAVGALGSGVIAPTNIAPARGLLAQAQGAGSVGGAPGSITYGGDTQDLRRQLTTSLGALSGAPNRAGLAADAYEQLLERAAPRRDQERRAAGQRVAALGRTGAGMTTSELNDLELAFEREDALTRRQLAGDAAAAELGDRLNIAGALQGGFGTLAGQDVTDAAFGADAARFNANLGLQRADLFRGLAGDEASLAGVARRDAESDRAHGLDRASMLARFGDTLFDRGSRLRDEARGERRDRLGFEQADLDARRSIFGDLAGREDQLFRQGRAERDEFRGERDFQTGAAERALDRRIEQRALEETLFGNEFGRRQRELGLLDDLGYGYDPSGALLGEAGALGEEAAGAFGGVGDLLGELGARSGLGGSRGGNPSILPLPDPGLDPVFGGPIDWRQGRATRPLVSRPGTLGRRPDFLGG